MRAIRFLAVIYLLFTAFGVVMWRATRQPAPRAIVAPVAPILTPSDALTPQQWFDAARPSCSAATVYSVMEVLPPPAGPRGSAYAAACWALAGNADETRASILAGDPQTAAALVFGIIHPEADTGREAEMAAGMEVVLEFHPTHPMALYHAGSAAYADARLDAAREYLQRFLDVYPVEDGWRSNARSMLEMSEVR